MGYKTVLSNLGRLAKIAEDESAGSLFGGMKKETAQLLKDQRQLLENYAGMGGKKGAKAAFEGQLFDLQQAASQDQKRLARLKGLTASLGFGGDGGLGGGDTFGLGEATAFRPGVRPSAMGNALSGAGGFLQSAGGLIPGPGGAVASITGAILQVAGKLDKWASKQLQESFKFADYAPSILSTQLDYNKKVADIESYKGAMISESTQRLADADLRLRTSTAPFEATKQSISDEIAAFGKNRLSDLVDFGTAIANEAANMFAPNGKQITYEELKKEMEDKKNSESVIDLVEWAVDEQWIYDYGCPHDMRVNQ